MSKHETWRTRKYWNSVGGYLIEEFQAIKEDKSRNISRKSIDGIIVLGEQKHRQSGGQYNIEGKDIIVVQTKGGGLGMYLMGQAYFSVKIMERFNPRSIKSVAICGRSDHEMEVLCREHDIEVVVIPESENPDK
ncbi:hypothetical protein [Endozoicomonas sp. ONNA2]|uniref:hypothetical protein n=1 Tax=Endozoicomonas sp. ONNA2 TaxID=2828741 RepID=UPI0021482B82|nr:hypothetical protein [Endozoicomonas sp. ONNA2]